MSTDQAPSAADRGSELTEGLGLVERLRRAGNDYTLEYGSGDLFDLAADAIEELSDAVFAVLACQQSDPMRKHPPGTPGKGERVTINATATVVQQLRRALGPNVRGNAETHDGT